MGSGPARASPCRLQEKRGHEKHARAASDDVSDVQACWLQAGHFLAASRGPRGTGEQKYLRGSHGSGEKPWCLLFQGTDAHGHSKIKKGTCPKRGAGGRETESERGRSGPPLQGAWSLEK
jgi:hypothetical protein